MICEVKDCDRKGSRRQALDGMFVCNMHMDRWRRHKSFDTLRPRDRKCSIEGCEGKHNAHGYCSRHVKSLQYHGDPLKAERQHRGKCVLCHRAHHAKGLCWTHYRRYKRWGDPMFDGRHYLECKIEGCYSPTNNRGLCAKHYYRWRKHGDPLGGFTSPWGETLPMEPLVEAMAAKGGVAARARAMGWDEKVVNVFETQYRRALADGAIDLTYADELCCKVLGVHPALIWPDLYWQEVEDDWEEAA